MGQWLRRFWNDEVAFRTTLRSGFRFLIAFVGYLMDQGIVPTGVPGGGNKYGMLLIVLAFLVSSSQGSGLRLAALSEPATKAAA